MEKGLVKFRGECFVTHIIKAVSPVTNHITIISNNNSYHDFGYKVIRDIIPGKGPLSGIHAGLHHSRSSHSLFIPCDTPMVSTALIAFMINSVKKEGVTYIAQHAGRVEPLFGIYARSVLASIERFTRENELRVNNILNYLNTKYIPVEEQAFYNSTLFNNLNSMSDLKKMEEAFLYA